MAKTDRDRLIKTFMSRNRRKGKGPLDQGFPSNPGKLPPFRPYKGGVPVPVRNDDPAIHDVANRGARYEVANRDARHDVANRDARHDVARGPASGKLYRLNTTPPSGPGQYFIPGIGSAIRQRNLNEQIRKNPHQQGDPYKVPDGGWRVPHHPRRGRTRSTPGSAYRRKKPTVN